MQPRIVILKAKKLVGKKLKMSLANNKTFELWHSFMPERKSVENKVSNELVSMRVYDGPLQLTNASQVFEKWATVEVSDFGVIPIGMEAFDLNSGLYAVFDYKGLNTDNSIFIYIFKEWLPSSRYELDERPHFEILGAKYENNDPDSEEEVWIPIKPK